mgnify:CR=1 FL=1
MTTVLDIIPRHFRRWPTEANTAIIHKLLVLPAKTIIGAMRQEWQGVLHRLNYKTLQFFRFFCEGFMIFLTLQPHYPPLSLHPVLNPAANTLARLHREVAVDK